MKTIRTVPYHWCDDLEELVMDLVLNQVVELVVGLVKVVVWCCVTVEHDWMVWWASAHLPPPATTDTGETDWSLEHSDTQDTV